MDDSTAMPGGAAVLSLKTGDKREAAEMGSAGIGQKNNRPTDGQSGKKVKGYNHLEKVLKNALGTFWEQSKKILGTFWEQRRLKKTI